MNRENDFSDRTRIQNSDPNSRPLSDETINTRPATPDEVAYRNGYTEAQQRERIQENIRQTRENNSAATGIVIGVILASIVGLTLATLALLSGDRQPDPPTGVPSPTQPQTTTPPQNQTTERTTIIERAPQPAPQQTEIIVPSPAQPSVTQPSDTQPSVTEPSVTQPPVTQPQLTQPETTQPNTLPSEVPATSDGTTVPPTTAPTDSTGVGQ
jgi:hypothetical protein